MVKRDFYAILGVPARAEPAEIKRAYRRLAFSLHPDVGPNADPERFREVSEAYAVLSDPNQRRAYDVKRTESRQPLSAEPLRAKSPITVFEDYLTLRPTAEEVIDHIVQNFFGYRYKSGEPYRRLGMEAILEPEEARFGCRLPLRVPCCVECPQCNDTGETWAGSFCPRCYGRGRIDTVRQATVEIPPGTRDGERYAIDLSSAGINNLLLEVRIVVP
jgi:molecular chaperone DnaJ